MAKILGIDLGTTNSAMAVVVGGEPKIVENKEGNRTTPSIVAIQKTGERVAGLLAKRQAVTNSQNTLFSIKRLIGRRYDDPEVQRDKKLLPYEIRAASDGSVEIKMSDPSTSSASSPQAGSGQVRWHKPQEISAMVLQKLKHDAEDKLGEKITEAVITVPAYFNDAQRKATKEAGEIAGLDVKRILNEPTAAALAYGLGKKKEEKIVVYDFGGGTFDVSVLEVSQDTVEVKAVGGDTHLGGDDFDQKIIHHLIDEFKKDQGIDLSKDTLALQRLKEAAEKAKHELSSVLETEINIPFITTDANGPKHFLIRFTRAKLEDLVRPEIEKSVEHTRTAVAEAGFKLSEINEVILVGGQTRMPAMQEAVKKLFGKEPHKNINPDEVVALGAGIQGEILLAKDEGRRPAGDVKDILLLDVTPLSLGLETLGGVMTVLIAKNTTIPTAKTQTFSTAADNQPQVEIHILQGERPMAADNKTLGKFILDGIPPSPRGVPQIEVAFDIDANGILSVSAKDKASGKSQSIRIEGSSGLSKEEIERMKREAEAHAQEDERKKELSEARIMAESLIYTAEKTLRDLNEKIPSDVKKEVEEKMEDLRKVKDSETAAEIKSKTEALSQALQKIGADLYKQAQADGADQKSGGDDKKDDKAEEGEFKDK